MARTDISQADALDAVVLRLQTELTLSERQCYPVARAQDVPSIPVGGNFWLTVAIGGGTFIPEEQSAGNVTEDADCIVTAYTRIRTDSTSHDRDLLLDDARGLLAIKKLILAAMCGHDLLDPEGDSFLRQLVFARNCSNPDKVNIPDATGAFGQIQITFGIMFDWSLS